MGTYDDDVEEKLGNNAFNLILSYAESGKINNQQVADIAKELEPSVILGNHKRRGNKTGRNEMREILSDWCQFSDSFGAMSDASSDKHIQRKDSFTEALGLQL